MLKEFVNLLFEITLKNDFIIRVNLSAMCKIKKNKSLIRHMQRLN